MVNGGVNVSKRSYIKSKKRVRILIEIIMIIITAVHLFPVFNLVCSSLKTSGDLMYHPVGLPHEIDLSNYQVAWETLDYLRTLFNTTFICVVSILLIVLVGAFAAYPIARYNLKFNKVMYYVFLALIMIPGQAILIPLVRMYYRLGLVNTYHGMVIVSVSYTHLPTFSLRYIFPAGAKIYQFLLTGKQSSQIKRTATLIWNANGMREIL